MPAQRQPRLQPPKMLIIGTGYYGRMQVPEETLDSLRAAGVAVRVAKTSEAVRVQPVAEGVRTHRCRPASHLLMLVRGVNRTDAPQISQFYYETVRRVNARGYNPEQIRASAPRVYLDAFLHKRFRHYSVFVAEEEGIIVGFGELARTGEIDCFYINHASQRRGVGSARMAGIEREARSRGNGRLSADVSLTAEPFLSPHGIQGHQATDEGLPQPIFQAGRDGETAGAHSGRVIHCAEGPTESRVSLRAPSA